MLGSIIGDIVGSIYEFHNIKTKDFPLFSERCGYTDDSILTIATAKYWKEEAKVTVVGIISVMHLIILVLKAGMVVASLSGFTEQRMVTSLPIIAVVMAVQCV